MHPESIMRQGESERCTRHHRGAALRRTNSAPFLKLFAEMVPEPSKSAPQGLKPSDFIGFIRHD